MPYIKLADRPMFNTMIDGLISKIYGYNRIDMAYVAACLVTRALTPALPSQPQPDGSLLASNIDGTVSDLARRIRVRGDANYCLCRILLESMKPETGWSYHSLSDVIAVVGQAFNVVFDIQRDYALSDGDMLDATSVLDDVGVEINRRLLGPYEDQAILKNGDMACFANEDFAYKPLPPVFKREDWRGRCSCKCESGDDDSPINVPDLNMSGLVSDDIPPITDALTQSQCDAVDKGRP